MKSRTLHISFPNMDNDLHSELMRNSALKHIPTSLQARIWMRKGMKAEETEKAGTLL